MKIVLKEHSGRLAHWHEIDQFLSSYGSNPGNEGSYVLLHRVFWRMKRDARVKDGSKEKQKGD